MSDRTIQQRDPLGAMGVRPLTLVVAAGAPVFALVMTYLNRQDVTSWPLAIGAILVLMASCFTLARESNALRAPVTTRTALLVVALVVVAFALSALSMWGGNAYIRDDWGPTAIGLVMLALAPYRPVRDILFLGISSAVIVGLVVTLQSLQSATDAPLVLYILMAVAPLLGLMLAAAAFAHSLMAGLDRWRDQASRAAIALDRDGNNWLARSVQQDRVSFLSQEVMPFYTELARKGSLNEEDRQRAREISNEIRAAMVARVERSWLEAAVEHEIGSRTAEQLLALDLIDDEHRLAARMSTSQRTALRAVVVALFSDPAFDPSEFRVHFRRGDGRCLVTLSATLTGSDPAVRNDLAPYLAVLRIAFTDLAVDSDPPLLTLRFSYGYQ